MNENNNIATQKKGTARSTITNEAPAANSKSSLPRDHTPSKTLNVNTMIPIIKCNAASISGMTSVLSRGGLDTPTWL